MKIIYDIQWDTDGDENIAAALPKCMMVPEGMSDKEEISDWISNETEFCHKGFKLIDTCPKRLKVPCASGKSLVAEVNEDPDYKEIYIYLENDDGTWYQDLAIVGEEYEHAVTRLVPVPGRYSVKVYADENSEDFNYDFGISEYAEGGENEQQSS